MCWRGHIIERLLKLLYESGNSIGYDTFLVII